jgi:GNAT superfamily N-acetyltransferase
MSLTVGIVDPSRSYLLRQRVLRPHQSLEAVAADNNIFGALTFGASKGPAGEVMSTSTIYHETPPVELTPIVELSASRQAWRLRAVATDEHHRSQGLGKLVLDAVIDHIAGEGDGVLWCNARIPARNFYAREGFESFGEIFVVPEFGPHIVMYRAIDARV